MVSSVCRGPVSSMSPAVAASALKANVVPQRKLNIDPLKDYSCPLQVETTVEYDLPSHIYPPKGAEPILMIHPAFSFLSKWKTAQVPLSSTPTKTVTTNGTGRQCVSRVSSTSTKAPSRVTPSRWCYCGHPNCVVTGSFQPQSQRTTQSVLHDRKCAPPASRSSASNQVKTPSAILQQQVIAWMGTGRCLGPCCNPRPATGASAQSEFVAPGLPPSLMTRTPARGSAGGSPKLRATRTRRSLNVASSVNLPEYLGGASRATRIGLSSTASVPHARTRTMSMCTLAAAPAPPLAHQASLSTSMELPRVAHLTPKSLFSSMPHHPSSSLFPTVGLSRDSGCSVGGPSGADQSITSVSCTSLDRSRGLVDSGFCTPVDISEDATQTSESLKTGLVNPSSREAFLHWKDSLSCTPTALYGGNSGIPSTSFLPTSQHYVNQPIWNLAY